MKEAIESMDNAPLEISRQPPRQRNHSFFFRLLVPIASQRPPPSITCTEIECLNLHPQQLQLLLGFLYPRMNLGPEFQAGLVALADGSGEVAQSVNQRLDLS